MDTFTDSFPKILDAYTNSIYTQLYILLLQEPGHRGYISMFLYLPLHAFSTASDFLSIDIRGQGDLANYVFRQIHHVTLLVCVVHAWIQPPNT